jgi:hypothetical protein
LDPKANVLDGSCVASAFEMLDLRDAVLVRDLHSQEVYRWRFGKRLQKTKTFQETSWRPLLANSSRFSGG